MMYCSCVAGKVDADLISKYIVLAGAYCLLRYIENCSGFLFPSNSIRVIFTSQTPGKLFIDSQTAKNLELITDLRSGNQIASLYGAIKMTKTVVVLESFCILFSLISR